MFDAGTPTPSREQLTDAALRVARRDGVAALDAGTVATEAGVGRDVVRSVFPDDADLAVALAAALNRRMRRALAIPVSTGGRIEDCLVGGLRGLWSEIEGRGADAVVAVDLALVAARRQPFVAGSRRQREEGVSAMRDFLSSAAGSTRSRWVLPLDQLTEFALNAVAGASLSFVADRDGRQGRRRLETLGRVLARCAVPLDPPDPWA